MILAPGDSSVYHKGDEFTLRVKYDVTFLCGEITSDTTIIEDYTIKTEGFPPKRHTLYAEGYDVGGNPVRDEMDIWVVEFFVFKDFLPKTSVAPLKAGGDSIGILFGVDPPDYFNPSQKPSPDSIVVRVYDKEFNLVFGSEEYDNYPHLVYYWKGKDNNNKAANPYNSSYIVEMRMYYKDDKYVVDDAKINVIPALKKGIILTKGLNLNPEASNTIPTSLSMYTFPMHNIDFYGLLYSRVRETGNNADDYKYFTLTGEPSQVEVKEGNDTVTVSVEKWDEELWGELGLKWFEVKPYISDDDNDVVSYDRRSELTGWGWGNEISLLSGTHRYIMSIGETETHQEAKSDSGIYMATVGVLGGINQFSVVDWSSSYLTVPYVYEYHDNQYGQNIGKTTHNGYEGNDCSGLACWAFIWSGEPLCNLNPKYCGSPEEVVGYTGATTLHGKKGEAQHVVKTEYFNSDDDVDWDGYDDADLDKDKVIEPGEEMTILQTKLDLAEPGDMWFIDYKYGEHGVLGDQCDHVGIYFERVIGNKVYNRIIEASGGKDKVRTTDGDLKPDPREARKWNGRYEESIFRGLRRRSE